MASSGVVYGSGGAADSGMSHGYGGSRHSVECRAVRLWMLSAAFSRALSCDHAHHRVLSSSATS